MDKKVIIWGSVGLLSALLVGCAANPGVTLPARSATASSVTVDPHAQTLTQLAAAETRSVWLLATNATAGHLTATSDVDTVVVLSHGQATVYNTDLRVGTALAKTPTAIVAQAKRDDAAFFKQAMGKRLTASQKILTAKQRSIPDGYWWPGPGRVEHILATQAQDYEQVVKLAKAAQYPAPEPTPFYTHTEENGETFNLLATRASQRQQARNPKPEPFFDAEKLTAWLGTTTVSSQAFDTAMTRTIAGKSVSYLHQKNGHQSFVLLTDDPAPSLRIDDI